MTIQFANAIVQRLGPCRIALDNAAHEGLARELALMGCDIADIMKAEPAKSSNGPTAGFLAWTEPNPKNSFADAIRPFRRMDALVLQSAGQDRRVIERSLFEAGWQRHPGGMMLGEYPAWSGNTLPMLSYYSRASHGGGAHELQKGSIEADATIARYAIAANHVRPGDQILVDGMGSSDGVAILAAQSRAGSITRVATKARAGTIDASLVAIADHSIDMVVAFEPAMPADWIARLADFARVLKYDGRLVIGWRQLGQDPTRPSNWEGLLNVASELFVPEIRYVQIPVGGDPNGSHAIFPVDKEQAVATEWLIMVASANPLLGESTAADYDHPAFPNAMGTRPALVDFGAAYDNPWLYRSMVQMGERLGDDLKLARLAECVIEDSRDNSADRGAAIAVLGYRVLELRLTHLVNQIISLIAAYVDQPLGDDTPVHVRRWRISLAFLAGRLSELNGDREAAKRWYREAADGEWIAFSPLLATKTIAATFYHARLLLADGDSPAALTCFQRGVETALAAAAFPHGEQMGPADQPLSFYLTELAEVIDMGSQCANAVAHFHLWHRDPGLFWRQVDVRRFGLASWARDLEQENQRLRAA